MTEEKEVVDLGEKKEKELQDSLDYEFYDLRESYFENPDTALIIIDKRLEELSKIHNIKKSILEKAFYKSVKKQEKLMKIEEDEKKEKEKELKKQQKAREKLMKKEADDEIKTLKIIKTQYKENEKLLDKIDEINKKEINEEIKKNISILKSKDVESEKKIIWMSENQTYYNSWKRCKRHTLTKLRYSNPLNEEQGKLILYANSLDEIEGRPLKVFENKQNITLITKSIKKSDDDSIIYTFNFLDDNFKQPLECETFEEDFFVYKVIFDNKEFFVFSKDELEPENYIFKGIKIPINNQSELMKNFRFKGKKTIFLLKETKKASLLTSKELLNIIKKLDLTQEDFINLLFLHPDGNVYKRSEFYNLLRVCQILSGKIDGYPLHTLGFSSAGFGKTYEIESIDYKFQEEHGILEAGSSTLKALIPSYRENPVNIGYILKCSRVSLMDELCKLISNMMIMGIGSDLVLAQFGQLNFILEHKKRSVGSGNSNFAEVKASSKCIFMTNPLKNRQTIASHLQVIDQTTLSRLLIYSIDKEEQKFFIETKKNKKNQKELKDSISRVTDSISTNKFLIINNNNNSKSFSYSDILCVFMCKIFDFCQNRTSMFDDFRLGQIQERLIAKIEKECKEMLPIWTPRDIHHISLLLDGIVKFRSLFVDRIDVFEAKEEDYELLEKLLNRIIESWNCKFEPDDWRDTFKN